MVVSIVLVLLFLWIGPALLCAAIAGGKNRSAAGWLIAGLFFGMLAFLILLCLPKGEPTTRTVMTQAPARASKDPFNRG